MLRAALQDLSDLKGAALNLIKDIFENILFISLLNSFTGPRTVENVVLNETLKSINQASFFRFLF